MEATTVTPASAVRVPGWPARVARRTVGGLPRPFWVLWAGTLVNRLGLFVEPFLALYLSHARHLSLTEVGAVLAPAMAPDRCPHSRSGACSRTGSAAGRR